MIITALVENALVENALVENALINDSPSENALNRNSPIQSASANGTLGAELGLSLLLQTQAKMILFDTGKSGLFLQNAQALGFDLSRVDLAIVSHGHYDHGGGLDTFLKVNDHAPIYIRAGAFERHLSERMNAERANIGLDPALLESGRFMLTGAREA